VKVSAAAATKCGIVGTRIAVEIAGREEHEHAHAHEHAHRSLPEIENLLAGLPVAPAVREHAAAVYRLIADAESAVHGRPAREIHFHEIGQLDAVADIVGVSILMERLRPARIVASPVRVGSGQVATAHGRLPVPAPATALLLRGIPCEAGDIAGELCTPTGAALLRHFAAEFGPLPPMRIERTGYGMGMKDFAAANCVRAFWGEAADAAPGVRDAVAELRCNLDDMSGEAIAHAVGILFDAGALDVFTVPVQMKKGRPGALLTCLCAPAEAERFAALMLRHTSSFGVRQTLCQRYILARTAGERRTALGPVRFKRGEGHGVVKSKPEYEDVAEAARRRGLSFAEAMDEILKED